MSSGKCPETAAKMMDVTTIYGSGAPENVFRQRVSFTGKSETENRVVNLYPELLYETFEGFGGAVTDSAGIVYQMMSDSDKEALLTALYSPERMNYQFARVPIDSCDFSPEQHEALSDPSDQDLKSFSMAGMEQYIIPLLEDIRAYRKDRFSLMLSVWSPPVFMKTNGRREGGGKLKEEYRELYAEYLCRYIEEFQNRGFHVQRITVQNEPKAVQIWDSCVYTAEEEKEFLTEYMRPAMERHGLTGIEVFIWDHNKERVYEWMRDIVDEKTRHFITGAAVHWYSGDHFEALDLCRELYPDKKLIASESCFEFLKYGSERSGEAAGKLAHDILGDLAHGVTAYYDWNILLDERGGPSYAGNYCMALFMYDRGTGVLRSGTARQYYELISHNLEPGSRRIAMTRFTGDIDAAAFKRPDGKIVLFLLNKVKEEKPVTVRLEDGEASLILPPEAITCCLID